ncbi:MAG: hypothetical protein ACI4JM_07330 [Oscillospiraceae bacterium]
MKIMQEEYIIKKVTDWFYEDLVNDVLGLRTNIILDASGNPYRYPLSADYDSKADNRIDRFRNNSVNAKLRSDKRAFTIGNTRPRNNADDIIYGTIATLFNLMEENKTQPYKEPEKVSKADIRRYFREHSLDDIKELNNIYSCHSECNNDEILEILNNTDKTDSLIGALRSIIPVEKILAMYMYYVYHREYWEDIYKAFEDLFVQYCSGYGSYTALMSANRQKIQDIQQSIKEDIPKIRQEIFKNAFNASKQYPIIESLIPQELTIEKELKEIYKKWDKEQKKRSKFVSIGTIMYETDIKEKIKKDLLIPIALKGSSDRYSDDSAGTVTLETLNNTIIPGIKETFNFKVNGRERYKYPALTQQVINIKSFVSHCEQYHIAKYACIKKSIEYDVLTNTELVKAFAHLFVFIFIMCAFDSEQYKHLLDNRNKIAETFGKYINSIVNQQKTKVILIYYLALINNKILDDNHVFSKIIKEIIKRSN